jgi:hypothetical protein
MWDRAGGGEYESYVPCERLIRIFADLEDRDPFELSGPGKGRPGHLTTKRRDRLGRYRVPGQPGLAEAAVGDGGSNARVRLYVSRIEGFFP